MHPKNLHSSDQPGLRKYGRAIPYSEAVIQSMSQDGERNVTVHKYKLTKAYYRRKLLRTISFDELIIVFDILI